MEAWTDPGLADVRIRRDLLKYARTKIDKPDLVRATNRLAEFSGDVLVLWSRNRVMPVAHAEALAELTGGTLRYVDDAKVLIMLDQPEETARAIAEFLKALSTPICLICAQTSTTPQVSATRPSTKRKMKISLYVTDLPVGGSAHELPLLGTGDGVPDDDLVSRRDQIVNGDMEIGIDREEHRPHLLELLRACRVDRQWGADLRIRQDEFVDGPRESVDVARVHRVMEAVERSPCSGFPRPWTVDAPRVALFLVVELSRDVVRDVHVGVDVLYVVAVFERVDQLDHLACAVEVDRHCHR